MIRKIFAITFLIALPLASVFAQQKADYSGTWKLNVAKSDFGAMPALNSRTDVITHKETSLINHVAADGQQGKLDYTVNYSTDGKEVTNTIGTRVTKSTAKWEGNNLVIDSKFTANDADINIVSTWVLAADGKTLTISVHISAAVGETDQKLIFEKQESATTAPAK